MMPAEKVEDWELQHGGECALQARVWEILSTGTPCDWASLARPIRALLKRSRLHPAFLRQLVSVDPPTLHHALLVFEKTLGQDASWLEFLYSMSLSALHAREDSLFSKIVDRLSSLLGDVPRLKLLSVMRKEADRNWDEAQLHYMTTLSKDGDPPSSARLVAVLRSQLKHQEALIALQRYLQDVPADRAAWQEMCKIACELHDFDRAAFAACQCVLLLPTCPRTAERAAEVYYTLGDYQTARGYYSRSIQLSSTGKGFGGKGEAGQGQDLRTIPLGPIWGLWLSCKALSARANSSEATETEGDERNQSLLSWSTRLLRNTYTKAKEKGCMSSAVAALQMLSV